YTGLWILICFIFQAIFSWKLLEKITNDKWFKLLGSTFFVLAPPLLWRLHGHYQFLGQWLILAGMLLYFSSSYNNYIWTILLGISSLVHPYFVFMLLMIWLADLIKRKIFNAFTYSKLAKYILFTILILTLVMWQAGYFMVHDGLKAWGFGYYRMNLLSFIDPSDVNFGSWSYILKKQPHAEGDYEGFSYLGLGMLILGIIGLVKFLEQRQIKNFFPQFKKLIPLVSITFLLMIYALSNHVGFGRYELLQYSMPDFVNVFRVSGRMVLPFYYLIYLSILYLVIIGYRKLIAKIFIFICLTVQIADSSGVHNHFRNWLSNPPVYVSPLKSLIWIEAAKKYKKIIYVLPSDTVDWPALPLINYAAFNKLNINTGYFARVDIKKLKDYRMQLLNNLKNRKLDRESLYVVKDDYVRRFIVSRKMNLPFQVKEADGFFLLLPNWRTKSSNIEQINWAKYIIYKLGSKISFQKLNFNNKDYLTLIEGWSFSEEEATWTDGDTSIFLLRLAEKPSSNLILTIDAVPFVRVNHPTLKVDIFVNHRYIGCITYNYANFSNVNTIEIPNSLIGPGNLIEVQFVFKNAISPFKLSLSADTRRLGLFIKSLTFNTK
ncbi:MAG: DUF6311 domain-containing protein, partial [Candidatus Aquirickettsiella sp.]